VIHHKTIPQSSLHTSASCEILTVPVQSLVIA
jgi:hypothetical protein